MADVGQAAGGQRGGVAVPGAVLSDQLGAVAEPAPAGVPAVQGGLDGTGPNWSHGRGRQGPLAAGTAQNPMVFPGMGQTRSGARGGASRPRTRGTRQTECPGTKVPGDGDSVGESAAVVDPNEGTKPKSAVTPPWVLGGMAQGVGR